MKQSRRDFIKCGALAAGALPLLSYSDILPHFTLNKPAMIEIYNTNWGYEGSLEEFCRASKDAGYDGIEVWAPTSEEARQKLVNTAQDSSLSFGLLAGNWGKTFEENLTSFKTSVQNAISCKPKFINCHSGKDFYTFDQNIQFIEYTIEQSQIYNIPIYHETHRGRILYSAPIARQFLEENKSLRLTLDISHWTVVHESFLEDQAEVVDLALERTSHIHARVGFQEAPQIPNPSSKYFEKAVLAHFNWWDKVVAKHAESNKKLTMTTEFGPPPYMWSSPETGLPLENVWDMNVLMMKMWKERYA